ncbi:hypothetical protein MPAN_007320 [Mariniplasma anaerobium]|uniref:Uncharacterized protein n=1 Tax=Mariniplasma anaerobium TaxID=2735436 RepID=A0A7U9XV28_9MOLU|nr:hypothetical protein MPAN_007320 [Mariniplasma anaerobium]
MVCMFIPIVSTNTSPGWSITANPANRPYVARNDIPASYTAFFLVKPVIKATYIGIEQN